MSKADHLAAYAEGWTTGNSDTLVSALADNYMLDDPNHGRVIRGDMAAYLDGMKATVSEFRGGLIKVADDGVVSERLTYYTALPG